METRKVELPKPKTGCSLRVFAVKETAAHQDCAQMMAADMQQQKRLSCMLGPSIFQGFAPLIPTGQTVPCLR